MTDSTNVPDPTASDSPSSNPDRETEPTALASNASEDGTGGGNPGTKNGERFFQVKKPADRQT